MANTKKLRKVRRKLWEQNPHCHWCGCLTDWYNPPNGNLPPNAATIDHLLSRLNPERYYLPYYPQSLMVIACYKCNTERGAREERELLQQIQWTTRANLKNLLTNRETVVSS